jgi:hypothetical protein
MLHTLHISIVETSIKIFPVGFVNRFNHLKTPDTRAMMKTIARIVRPIRALIHRGDSTQTHGQVILPVSFRPINRTVSRPGKPIPLEEDEELPDI